MAIDEVRGGGVATPRVAGRAGFEDELGRLRMREKDHTHEGDAIAAD
jgi:hypothetical protein